MFGFVISMFVMLAFFVGMLMWQSWMVHGRLNPLGDMRIRDVFKALWQMVASTVDPVALQKASAFYSDTAARWLCLTFTAVGCVFICVSGSKVRGQNTSLGAVCWAWITESCLSIHKKRSTYKPLRFDLNSLCWFNRPRMMQRNKMVLSDEFEMHFAAGDRWYAIELSSNTSNIDKLNQAVKAVAPIYHRPQAFTVFAPMKGQRAEQDLQGSWQLHSQKAMLALSDAALVVWEGDEMYSYDFAAMTQVAAFQRLDKTFAQGLVRFEYGGQDVAFTVNNYQQFAIALAEMAGVELEWDAGMRKGKKLRKSSRSAYKLSDEDYAMLEAFAEEERQESEH